MTVYITHATLICGKIRILTPLWIDFELPITVNVWSVALDDQLTNHFIIKGCLKGEVHLQFLHKELQLLEDMFLNKQGCMYS
jgi:hypothetical protein